MHLVAIGLTGHDPELVADRCWQAGAAGLWEVDAATLRVGVDDGEIGTFLDLLADLGPVDVTEVEAVELAGRSSTVEVAGRAIDLWVPATVFGDGEHPTTATCLSLLPEVVSVADRVLDVGCGTGALSIGAAVFGARVTAIDVDPAAVGATADNAARNGVAIETSSAALDDVAGRFDVVLANLTVGALTPLLDGLLRCTAPGGSLALSGMLEDQWPGIRQAVGGRVVTQRVVEGWVTAVVQPDG